jgi:hypothetical protein
MSKRKVIPTKSTMIRLPKPLHDRLVKLSADRSIKVGKRVGVSSLIIEAVQQALTPAA